MNQAAQTAPSDPEHHRRLLQHRQTPRKKIATIAISRELVLTRAWRLLAGPEPADTSATAAMNREGHDPGQPCSITGACAALDHVT